MRACSLCKNEIGLGSPTVSIVGGQFPREDPDFFMVDETVLSESYAHLKCLLRLASSVPQNEAEPG